MLIQFVDQVLRKRIKLVIQLFKEAGRAIHAMPLLVLLPLGVRNFLTFFMKLKVAKLRHEVTIVQIKICPRTFLNSRIFIQGEP